MQYFVGSFDGTTFKNENPPNRVLWTDYGKDFYAAVSWSDIPVGTSFAYCQLLIHPNQSLRPSDFGISDQLTAA